MARRAGLSVIMVNRRGEWFGIVCEEILVDQAGFVLYSGKIVLSYGKKEIFTGCGYGGCGGGVWI